MSPSLAERFAAIKADAARLVGGLKDIPRRAAILHRLFKESDGNHVFPLIAAHGALWAFGFFEVGGSLGRFIGRRYFYNARERAYRLGLLDRFAEDFRTVNRQVCIDTYTNFHFTRQHGTEPGAADLVPTELLAALKRVHAAAQAGVRLSDDEKEAVFRQSFQWEQELTIAAGVKEAISKFDCKVMKTLCMMPLVRFAFFPRWRYIWFWNFADTAERVQKGLKAFAFARRKGWAGVEACLLDYGVLLADFLRETYRYYRRIDDVGVEGSLNLR